MPTGIPPSPVATTLAMWLFLLRSAMEIASSSLPSRNAPATCCTNTRDCLRAALYIRARSIITPKDHAERMNRITTTALAMIAHGAPHRPQVPLPLKGEVHCQYRQIRKHRRYAPLVFVRTRLAGHICIRSRHKLALPGQPAAGSDGRLTRPTRNSHQWSYPLRPVRRSRPSPDSASFARRPKRPLPAEDAQRQPAAH